MKFWLNEHPQIVIELCIRLIGSNGKVIPSYRCEQMDSVGSASLKATWKFYMTYSTKGGPFWGPLDLQYALGTILVL